MSSDFRKIRVTLVKSTIGQKQPARATVEALGLRKVQGSVVHTETPQIRGMVNRVIHLVQVDEVQDE